VIPTGNTVTYTVTVSALNGFNGTVTLETNGLPTGTGVTFTHPATAQSTPVVGSGGRTMTISTILPGNGGFVGTFPLIVTARSGSLAHSATLSTTVQGFSVTTSRTTVHVGCQPGSVTFRATGIGTHGLTASTQFAFLGIFAGTNSASHQWAPGFSPVVQQVDSQSADIRTNPKCERLPTGSNFKSLR
jgi:hypothetical protein